MNNRKVNKNAVKDFLTFNSELNQSNITQDNFDSKLGNALNFYRRSYSVKDSKKFLIELFPNLKKEIQRIPDITFHQFMTGGFTAKFIIDNKLTKDFHFETKKFLDEKIEEIKSYKRSGGNHNANVHKSIEKQLREKLGVIDEYFDDYIYGRKNDLNIQEYLKQCGFFFNANLRKIKSNYENELKEFKEIETDKYLQEAYQFITKSQIKKIIQFYEDNINQIESMIVVSKKRKPTSFKKITQNAKYLREYEGIVGMSPDKIVGSSVVVLYNVGNRKLSIIYSLSDSKFNVKGTSIIGIDEEKSKTKITKPDIDLSFYMKNNKKVIIDLFNLIKTKPQRSSSRLDGKTIILNVLK